MMDIKVDDIYHAYIDRNNKEKPWRSKAECFEETGGYVGNRTYIVIAASEEEVVWVIIDADDRSLVGEVVYHTYKEFMEMLFARTIWKEVVKPEPPAFDPLDRFLNLEL